MTIGGVLGEAWNLYKRFLGRFFLTALVVFAILDLFSALAAAAAGDSWVSGVIWGLVAVTIGVVGYFWVQAALVETVHDVRDGRADRSIGETYRAVQPVLPAVIVAGIVRPRPEIWPKRSARWLLSFATLNPRLVDWVMNRERRQLDRANR